MAGDRAPRASEVERVVQDILCIGLARSHQLVGDLEALWVNVAAIASGRSSIEVVMGVRTRTRSLRYTAFRENLRQNYESHFQVGQIS